MKSLLGLLVGLFAFGQSADASLMCSQESAEGNSGAVRYIEIAHVDLEAGTLRMKKISGEEITGRLVENDLLGEGAFSLETDIAERFGLDAAFVEYGGRKLLLVSSIGSMEIPQALGCRE